MPDDRPLHRAGSTTCPLCHARVSGRGWAAPGGPVLACRECGLWFRHPNCRPDRAEEAAHYRTHENHTADRCYRAFLTRLVGPLVARVAPGRRGIDIGSGPSPALARLLAERGRPTTRWDPFFAPVAARLRRRYDFVVSSETVEHLHDVDAAWRRFAALLAPRRGVLVVMSRFPSAAEGRPDWWYFRDPTHVSFYPERTLHWLARRHGWRYERPRETVACFKCC